MESPSLTNPSIIKLTRFQDIYYENVVKSVYPTKRKEFLKMKKIRNVVALTLTFTLFTGCICPVEVSACNYTSVQTVKAEEKYWDRSYYGSNETSTATAAQLDELIDKIVEHRGTRDCPFVGKGETLKQIEDSYGVSAVACLAIWTWESEFGTSSLARNKNNYGGIFDSNGAKYFDSVEEGMLAQGKLLSESYINEGYVKYSSIASKYCPGNTTWAGNVSSIAQLYAGYLEDIIN